MFERIFKAYDVRGIVPEALDERAAWAIGAGAAEVLLAAGANPPAAPSRTVVVGRDMRRSSPALSRALMDGLLHGGADVVDIGRVDTPLVGFTVRALQAAGGVQVTASHNPAQYNGFKFCGRDARPIGSESGLADIRRAAERAHAGSSVPRGGSVATGARERALDPWPAYRTAIRAFLPRALLVDGERRLRVVIDASNGMAGTMVPRVFDAIPGLEIVPLHFDNDHGSFVHEPNPLVAANLRWTCEAVRACDADLGVCFDGDADRCMVVDGNGTPVGCDLLTAWLAERWLRREPGAAIVYDLRSTRAVRETVEALGGTPVECRVGHVFMKARLRETGAPFGGELSGHFYYRDMGATDCGARALADVLAALVEEGRPLAECIGPYRRYAQSGEINFECADAAAARRALRAAHPEAHVRELDGLTLECGTWWCNVRASNTEPLLRLNVEARTPSEVEARVAALAPYLGRRVAH